MDGKDPYVITDLLFVKKKPSFLSWHANDHETQISAQVQYFGLNQAISLMI